MYLLHTDYKCTAQLSIGENPLSCFVGMLNYILVLVLWKNSELKVYEWCLACF